MLGSETRTDNRFHPFFETDFDQFRVGLIDQFCRLTGRERSGRAKPSSSSSSSSSWPGKRDPGETVVVIVAWLSSSSSHSKQSNSSSSMLKPLLSSRSRSHRHLTASSPSSSSRHLKPSTSTQRERERENENKRGSSSERERKMRRGVRERARVFWVLYVARVGSVCTGADFLRPNPTRMFPKPVKTDWVGSVRLDFGFLGFFVTALPRTHENVFCSTKASPLISKKTSAPFISLLFFSPLIIVYL